MKKKRVDVACDLKCSLWTLRELVDGWIEAYGERAIFGTDAGYNNVEMHVTFDKEV